MPPTWWASPESLLASVWSAEVAPAWRTDARSCRPRLGSHDVVVAPDVRSLDTARRWRYAAGWRVSASPIGFRPTPRASGALAGRSAILCAAAPAPLRYGWRSLWSELFASRRPSCAGDGCIEPLFGAGRRAHGRGAAGMPIRSCSRRGRIVRTCSTNWASPSSGPAGTAIRTRRIRRTTTRRRPTPTRSCRSSSRRRTGRRSRPPSNGGSERRPEIVELLEREVYGRIPGNVPKVRWEVRETREVEAGGKTASPEAHDRRGGQLGLPADRSQDLHVADPAEGDQGPGAGADELRMDPVRAVAVRPQASGSRRPRVRLRRRTSLIAAGWGCATLNPTTVQDDAGGWQPRRFGPGADPNAKPTGAGLTRGIIGLVNHGRPRKPDQWGALRAWAWGASRGLDYLETVPEVDAKRVGIAGVSRYGKAALVTMAFDPRFAMGLIASSGKGGTRPVPPQLRREPGEPRHDRRLPLDGRELPEILGGRIVLRPQDRRRPARRFPHDAGPVRPAPDLHQPRHPGARRRALAGPSRAASWRRSPPSRPSGCWEPATWVGAMTTTTEKMPGVNVGHARRRARLASARRRPHRRPERRTLHPLGGGPVAGEPRKPRRCRASRGSIAAR